MKETHIIAGKTVNIFVPSSSKGNISRAIYLNGGYEDADKIWEAFSYEEMKSALIAIDGTLRLHRIRRRGCLKGERILPEGPIRTAIRLCG